MAVSHLKPPLDGGYANLAAAVLQSAITELQGFELREWLDTYTAAFWCAVCGVSVEAFKKEALR